MVTSAISSGLHRLPGYATSELTAASEYKRRLFSAVYCSDKNHASLNGIPPLLLQRYCDIEPCLDLDPKAPYLSPQGISEALDQLDIDGWSTSESFFDTTLLRAKVQLSTIREEILELSLGTNNPITFQIVRLVVWNSISYHSDVPVNSFNEAKMSLRSFHNDFTITTMTKCPRQLLVQYYMSKLI